MVYPGQFLRVTAIGTLFGVETFNWTISLVPRSGSTVGLAPDAGGDLPAIAQAVANFHATAGPGMAAVLKQLKVARIGVDGKYVDDAPTVHDYGTAGVAGNYLGTHILPAQTALAITLRSDRSRGLANAGRFFMPAIGQRVVEADGLISAADAGTVAEACTTMLSAINDLDGSWQVGIASDTREGAFRPVVQVEVGRVLDTVRSRRRSLEERYVASLSPVDVALAA